MWKEIDGRSSGDLVSAFEANQPSPIPGNNTQATHRIQAGQLGPCLHHDLVILLLLAGQLGHAAGATGQDSVRTACGRSTEHGRTAAVRMDTATVAASPPCLAHPHTIPATAMTPPPPAAGLELAAEHARHLVRSQRKALHVAHHCTGSRAGGATNQSAAWGAGHAPHRPSHQPHTPQASSQARA